jgi:putative membrane protein
MMNALSATASGLVLVLAITLARMAPEPHAMALDRQFVLQAEEINNAEVAEGRLAEARGATNTVRSLGRRMVHDHGIAGRRLDDIARSERIPVTQSLGTQGTSEFDALRHLHGHAFDAAYVRDNVPDHRHAIALLQREIDRGRNAAVRAWAARTLPVLKTHLQLFESALPG